MQFFYIRREKNMYQSTAVAHRDTSTLKVMNPINLTKTPINVYDERGYIVTLPPSNIKMNRDGNLPKPGPNVHYIVDGSTKYLLDIMVDARYKGILIKPHYYGSSASGCALYQLSLYYGSAEISIMSKKAC